MLDALHASLPQDPAAALTEIATRFPAGVDYETVYDTTIFVSDSIKSVIKTLLEAVLLVVLVVTLFLQTWRASIIPLLAVPISIVEPWATSKRALATDSPSIGAREDGGT